MVLAHSSHLAFVQSRWNVPVKDLVKIYAMMNMTGMNYLKNLTNQ